MIINTLTQQLLNKVETLPPAMQQEVLHFVEFLKSKIDQTAAQEAQSNSTQQVHFMEQIAARGTAFSEIKDPAAWQREIRAERPLPGRD